MAGLIISCIPFVINAPHQVVFYDEMCQDHRQKKFFDCSFFVIVALDNGTPQYARPTTSSMQRHRKTPIEDNYHFEANQDDFKYDKSRAEHEVNILKIEHYGRDKTSTKVHL